MSAWKKQLERKMDICRILRFFGATLACALMLSACSKDGAGSGAGERGEPCRVAVVLPMSGGLQENWHRTLKLLEDNVYRASQGLEPAIALSFEWYDEDNLDMSSLALQLQRDTAICAVIGGMYSADAEILQQALCRAGKPFFTFATTEEFVRKYSAKGNLWAMTETDITQCEVLLSRASMYGGRSVALLAGDNLYGKTFIDWLPFLAGELGLEVKGSFVYDAPEGSDAFLQACSSGADFLICVPSAVEDIPLIHKASVEVAELKGRSPRMLYSDIAFGKDVIAKLGTAVEGLEGVSYCSDPSSGFDLAYGQLFGEKPSKGEAQLYDAAMLLFYGLFHNRMTTGETLNESLRHIVRGTETVQGSWLPEDIRQVLSMLLEGRSPDINGASGSLDFDTRVFTNVTCTVYCNYYIYNGEYIIQDYNTTTGENRTDGTLAGWNWKASQMQEFEDSYSGPGYPALEGRKAVVIAGSSGWLNYRHQADALNMYAMLKEAGYSDDDIILIMEDDIANNPANPQPGVVRVSDGGPDLREGAVVDYRTSALSTQDLCDIFLGKSSDRLPCVLESTRGDNVLVFWSGHGSPGDEGGCGFLNWGSDGEFDADTVSGLLRDASSEGRFRKMLWLIEACYSGGIGQVSEGVPGVLFITAADYNETSKADVWSTALQIWMSNRFTSTLHECIASNPEISLRDLYHRLFLNTVGSHVMIYNTDNYGSLYSETLGEYLGRP